MLCREQLRSISYQIKRYILGDLVCNLKIKKYLLKTTEN